jgi:hypothetical protein
MNVFEFMDKVLTFAASGVDKFFIALLFVSLFGIFFVTIFNVVFSNFRLFEYNSKKQQSPEIKFDLNQNKKTEETVNTNNIYDLLIKAWEKHKKNKDS